MELLLPAGTIAALSTVRPLREFNVEITGFCCLLLLRQAVRDRSKSPPKSLTGLSGLQSWKR
jgi:hypothetical protein